MLPFLFSLVLVPIAIYIRRSLPETSCQSRRAQSTPLSWAPSSASTGAGLCWACCDDASTAVSSQFGNFMASYAIKALKLPPAVAQSAVLLAGMLTFAGALLAGWLCDRYGRKALMIVPRAALMLAIVPMLVWLHGAPTAGTLFIVVAVLATLTAMSGAASLVAVPGTDPDRDPQHDAVAGLRDRGDVVRRHDTARRHLADGRHGRPGVAGLVHRRHERDQPRRDGAAAGDARR